MTFVHNLTELLESKREEITAWMEAKRMDVPIPIYGSVDIRDAGWKIGVVDANHFPAGFNNVSEEDKPTLAELLQNHINSCLLYTSPSPRDGLLSRMPSSA